MPRPEKCRRICSEPKVKQFVPKGGGSGGEVVLGYDEFESLRLIDRENYSQLYCAEKMGVSRATVARIYESARKKLAETLVEGKVLRISGGDVVVCAHMRHECAGVEHCCHRKNTENNSEMTERKTEK